MSRNRFLIRLLIITVCLILLDVGLGSVLRHFYFKIRHGEQGRMNYAVDSCLSETIVLGSSRAEHHYVSPVISEKLHTTCYNAGKDKQRLRYCLALLKIFYTRYNPKVVILDLNPTAFEANESGLDELAVLLPYYASHPEIRSIVNERSRWEWVKARSTLYCYNSLPLKIIFNNLSAGRVEGDSNGYVPLVLQKEIIPDKPEKMSLNMPLDSSLVDCFKAIIRLTREHQTKLIVVISPIYYRLPPDLVTIRIAESICEREKIAFLNYSQSVPFLARGPGVWRDRGHLNDSCAHLFTEVLCRDILLMN